MWGSFWTQFQNRKNMNCHCSRKLNTFPLITILQVKSITLTITHAPVSYSTHAAPPRLDHMWPRSRVPTPSAGSIRCVPPGFHRQLRRQRADHRPPISRSRWPKWLSASFSFSRDISGIILAMQSCNHHQDHQNAKWPSSLYVWLFQILAWPRHIIRRLLLDWNYPPSL